MEWGESVAKAAVHMREMGDKARKRYRGTYIQPPIRE